MSPHQSYFDDATMSWNTPDMIETTCGLWPTAGLERTTGLDETDEEWSAWVEYRLLGEIVHRSVRAHKKQGLLSAGVSASFA